MFKNYKSFLEGKKKKFPNFKKVTFEDFTIIVGKDAKSNDYVTFTMGDDNDIWMHAKGVPGSHIIIKVNKLIPSESVLEYAASLAKKNSKAKNDDSVDVVYCKRRFVKKKKGMNDGQVKVDYINADTIKINKN